MQEQPLRSITISGITVTETTEGNTVTLSIGEQVTTFTREDFDKLYGIRNAFFKTDINVKCGTCGQEMPGRLEFTEKIATMIVEPCQTCAGKEPVNHENT
jgi:hypothetical protein